MDYEAFLQDFYRLERFGIKLGLDVITELLRRLGDPQARFPAVHVTGTNGKGSTCAFLAAILQASGLHVGLYTSPHLVRFNERIRVDGAPIPDDDVMRLYGQIRPHMEAMAVENAVHHPTFFEAATAMAFQHFAERKVDLAVIEVGMGGRYDATNVFHPEVSVLTCIGLEHTEHLGRTVRRIAREKSGIIKNGRPAVTLDQEALPEIEARCRLTGSPLTVVGRDVRVERLRSGLEGQTLRFTNGGDLAVTTTMLGPHQAENAALAFASILALRRRGWEISDEQVKAGFTAARWPGRLDVVRRDPLVLVDAAHNAPAAHVLAVALRELDLPKAILVFGVLADKDVEGMAAELVPFASRILTARPKTERAQGPERVRSAFTAAAISQGLPPPEIEERPNIAAAVHDALALAGTKGTVLITGSVYTAGEALEALGRAP